MTVHPILEAARLFIGWDYGTGDDATFVPQPADGLPRGLVRGDDEPTTVDCSTMTTALLAYAHPDGDWSFGTYKRMQVWPYLDDPWSPIEAVHMAGVGHPVPVPVAGRWHLAQCWVRLPEFDDVGQGHAVLMYASADGMRIAVLESQRGYGPRWRAGERLTLDNTNGNAESNTNLMWAQLLATYPGGICLAVLDDPEPEAEMPKITPRLERVVNIYGPGAPKYRPRRGKGVDPLVIVRLIAKLGPVLVELIEALSDGKITKEEGENIVQLLGTKGLEVIVEEVG